MSAEANPIIQTAVSSSASIGIRSPSSFVRPSNPQSWFLESSSDASVAAPTIQNGIHSPSRTPAVCRRRPALAQVTNTPRIVKATPSRTLVKVRRVERVQNSAPTPFPSLRPKLVKQPTCFPSVAPKMRFEDESRSPTRPARNCVSLHFTDCIFAILTLFSAFFLQVPSMERLDKNFSERIEMTRTSSHTPYYVAALGPKGRSAVHWSRRALMHVAGYWWRTGSLTSLPVLPLTLVDEEYWRRGVVDGPSPFSDGPRRDR